MCGLQAIAQPTILTRFAHQAERIAAIAQNGELELFNAISGKSLKRLRADVAGTGVNVRFSIDDKHLVVNDQSDRWAVFEVESGELVETSAWRSIIVEAAVSTTNSIVAFFSADGSVGVAQVIQGQAGLVEADVLPVGEERPDAAALSESGERVAILRNQIVDLWQRSGATH